MPATKKKVMPAAKKKEVVSRWYILTPEGSLSELSLVGGKVEGFDFSHHHEGLEKFAQYEMAKSRLVTEEPPHVKLMQRLELADYEPGSDPGNLRFLPKGAMIKGLLEQLVAQEMHRYGAMEVVTPIMYDQQHPALARYLKRFPARQYLVESPNKHCFLRFSACFGQFLIAADAPLSYRHLPLRMWEMAPSYRAELRGELAGLRRLRGFTMPDSHALCADLRQAKQELEVRWDVAASCQRAIGLPPLSLELGLRAVGSFWSANQRWIVGLVQRWGKPALLEMWDRRFFYFVFKHEWNFINAQGKASALTTDQIDVENARRYGITYTDAHGKSRYPIILHLSPSGAIERVMYALLEQAWIDKQAGKAPMLPFWLSPTQLRLCPVSDRWVQHAEEIAASLEQVRVDIDDRPESVAKKVREAEMEWVPFVVVIGEKEATGKGKLTVRERGRCYLHELGGAEHAGQRANEGIPRCAFTPAKAPEQEAVVPIGN